VISCGAHISPNGFTLSDIKHADGQFAALFYHPDRSLWWFWTQWKIKNRILITSIHQM